MNYSKTINSLGIGCFLLAAAPHANAQLAKWTFEGDSIATNNTPTADVGSGTASSIGMNIYATPNVGITKDDVTNGASGDTGANGVADLTKEWRVRGQAGTNGAANGWSSAAPIGTQGAVFATSTVGVATGSSINVSFDWYATSAGEANMMLEYTTNGTTWTDVPLTLGGSDAGLVVLNNSTSANTVHGSYVSDNLLNNGSSAGQDWFTGLTATITDPSAIGDASFAIEMVNASTGADDVNTAGTALNNSSGNWRFDNVTITAVAAPEPSSWVLAAIAAGVVVALRRRAARLL